MSGAGRAGAAGGRRTGDRPRLVARSIAGVAFAGEQLAKVVGGQPQCRAVDDIAGARLDVPKARFQPGNQKVRERQAVILQHGRNTFDGLDSSPMQGLRP